jgi:hypothetical protein
MFESSPDLSNPSERFQTDSEWLKNPVEQWRTDVSPVVDRYAHCRTPPKVAPPRFCDFTDMWVAGGYADELAAAGKTTGTGDPITPLIGFNESP